MLDPDFHALLRAIVAGDEAEARALLAARPALARMAAGEGATRQEATTWFFDEIGHYLYAGDTALHVAAAAHRPALVRALIDLGAGLEAANRHGARPLHHAADGAPGDARWDAGAQAATILALIEAGADPGAADKKGVTPLHRAVRTRAAAAVRALLDAGADPSRASRSGSTPRDLVRTNSGRSGSGHREAKANLAEITVLMQN